MTQIGDSLLGPAKRIVQERAMTVPREAVHIVQAELGNDVGLVGGLFQMRTDTIPKGHTVNWASISQAMNRVDVSGWYLSRYLSAQ